jgi:hypothetical protein
MSDLDSIRYRLELLLTKATPMSDFDRMINRPEAASYDNSPFSSSSAKSPKIPVAEEGEVQPYVSNRQKKIASRRLRQNKLDSLFDKMVSQGDNVDPRLMEKIQAQLGKMFKIGKTNDTNAPTDEREALARKFCAIRMNVERKKAMQRMENKPLKMEKLWGGDPAHVPEEGPNQLKQSQMNFFPQHEKAAPVRPQSTKEGQINTKFENQFNMKRPRRHSLVKSTLNYGFLLEKAEGPRDYSQPVDSAEAFKYRRNVPSERRANYEVLREQGFSPEEATRLKDWKPGPLRTIIQNKDMPDRGLDPEWIDNPQEKLGKETELMDDYKNAGIRKVPGMEPIDANEAQRLNQYYQQVGKPLIHVPTPEEFQSQMSQYKEMKREGKAPPMFNKAVTYLFDLDISKANNAIKELEDFIREYEATIRSRPKTWSPKDISQHTRMLNNAKQHLEGHYKNKLVAPTPAQPLQQQLPLEY